MGGEEGLTVPATPPESDVWRPTPAPYPSFVVVRRSGGLLLHQRARTLRWDAPRLDNRPVHTRPTPPWRKGSGLGRHGRRQTADSRQLQLDDTPARPFPFVDVCPVEGHPSTVHRATCRDGCPPVIMIPPRAASHPSPSVVPLPPLWPRAPSQ